MSGARWSTQVLQGYLAPEQVGEYYNVPFDMPPRVLRLEVSYTYSQAIASDPLLTGGNTLDIGLFDQRGAEYPGAGFRGWTGSARREFFITADDATPGYLPGPLEAGRWHISLGFYKSAPDGCHYEITLRFLIGDERTTRTEFPPLLKLDDQQGRLSPRPDGWYRGELHCHSWHSDGDAPPDEIVTVAQELGLDFLAITDHNSISHLAALARLDPGNLILIPGVEITTYKGHWNVWGLSEWIDFRTLSPALMEQSIRRAVQLGYLTSCNHPRTAGPPWEFREIRGQHCIEVWNGPWELFNHEALAYWESRLRAGERLVAVGGSDAHFLHKPHIARIGTPTTWAYCPDRPTARGILAGLRAGHAFVSDAPDGVQVYLVSGNAMMGDTIERPSDGRLTVQTRVVNGAGLCLEWCTAQGVVAQTVISEQDQTLSTTVPVAQTPYVRAQVVENGSTGSIVRALTNPLYLK